MIGGDGWAYDIKSICEWDRFREYGEHLDIQVSICSDKNNIIQTIFGGQYSICGPEFTPAMIRAIYNETSFTANVLENGWRCNSWCK